MQHPSYQYPIAVQHIPFEDFVVEIVVKVKHNNFATIPLATIDSALLNAATAVLRNPSIQGNFTPLYQNASFRTMNDDDGGRARENLDTDGPRAVDPFPSAYIGGGDRPDNRPDDARQVGTTGGICGESSEKSPDKPESPNLTKGQGDSAGPVVSEQMLPMPQDQPQESVPGRGNKTAPVPPPPPGEEDPEDLRPPRKKQK